MRKHWMIVLLALSVCVICGCPNNTLGTDAAEKGFEFFEQNPVSIYWPADSSKVIESYQADVEIYSSSNRDAKGVVLQNKYRMSVKTIDNAPHVRLDLAPELNGNQARSVLSTPTEMVVFDTFSGLVEMRVPAESGISSDFAFLNTETAMSRINLSHIRSEAKRLSFDITEDSNRALVVNLPPNLFPADEYRRRVSTRVSFDAAEDIFKEMEMVELLNDGTEITVKSWYMYEEHEGEPVKIGTVTIADTKVPYRVPGMEDYPLPIVTEATELGKNDEGSASHLKLGDPADLSSTETIVELYKDVQINTVNDSVFRIQ